MKPWLPLLIALAGVLPATAHFGVTPFPKVVQPGIPVGNLRTLDPDGMVVYRIEVPPGTARLNVQTSGGLGNALLFLKAGSHPGYNGVDAPYASRYPGTRQVLQVSQPQPGAWFIGVQGAHSGYVGVKLLAQTILPKGSILTPALKPAPGIHPGAVTVTMKARTKGSTVRYTTDGSDPEETSPLAPKTLLLTADTTLKARAFGKNGVAGPVAEGFYQVRPGGDVAELGNLEIVHHLGSAKGGRHLFRIAVDAGEKLIVTAEGGTGKSTIALKYGAVPPTGKPPRGDKSFIRAANRAEIAETQAGDYFIALDAATAIAGRSLIVRIAGDGPDLVPWAPVAQPYVSVEQFSELSCEVQEGMIGAGRRRLLRYTTQVRNAGSQDLVMPPPEDNPFFEYHDCHGHWHFKGFAASRLLDMEGNEVRSGRKVSFCLLDNIRWDRAAIARARYTCSRQGIQAGWGDVYDSGLPGQWIEIDDLPGGSYQLEIAVNPDGILFESDYGNNSVLIPVTIPDPD